MGILDFLKKIIEEPKEEENKKINSSNLEKVLEEKEREIKESEKNTILLINNKIEDLAKDIKEKIKVVESVDIEPKEKNDKIKSLVYEGRKKYIEFLERLIGNLEEYREIEDLNRIIENINSSFSRFNENSGKSYERATILIGKEMGSIRESLKKFSNEIINIFNENKEIISKSKKISNIKSKLSLNKEITLKINEIEKEINVKESKIKEKEKDLKEASEELQNIKNSLEYLKNIEMQKIAVQKEEEAKKEISELRQTIDFKALSSFFHIFEEKMKIIKLYKDNFHGEFKEDKGNKLLNLLNESKLNNNEILSKIKKAKELEKEISETKKRIGEDKTISVASEIESIKENIQNIKKEIEWEDRNKTKLNEEISKNNLQIKEELKSINLEIAV